jgi:hypothetical protein
MLPLLALAFACGIANFAMHKAVLASGHPILAQLPWLWRANGGRIGLMAEYLVLLGAMLTIASGAIGWGWGYALYTGVNALCAWLILTRRA